jgi:hypothetical protein
VGNLKGSFCKNGLPVRGRAERAFKVAPTYATPESGTRWQQRVLKRGSNGTSNSNGYVFHAGFI